MIIIYRAANIADAHLIRQMLEAEGIPAFIQGEYLQGAVGELPANTEILVHVADDNAGAARAIVDEWESAEPAVLEDDAPEDDAPENDALPEDRPQRPAAGGYSLAKGVVLFLVIVIGGAAAMSLLLRYAQS
jgi:Putative prokaryotic signal transducing protein